MLPILRILPVGGVLLAILLLILALNPPGSPRSQGSPSMVAARGALMERSHHPEWRQLLILAATRRATELNRLRDLPDTPTRTAPDIPIAIDTNKQNDDASRELQTSSGNSMQGGAQDSSQDSPQDSPRDSTEGSPQDPPKDASKDASGDSPEGSSQDQPRIAATDSSQVSPEASPQEPAQDSPRDSSQDAPKVAGLPADQDSAEPDDATGSTSKASGTTLPMEIGEPSASELPVTKQEELPPVVTPARLKSQQQTRTRRLRVARRYYQPLPKPPPFPPLFPFSLFFPGNTDPMARAGTINPD